MAKVAVIIISIPIIIITTITTITRDAVLINVVDYDGDPTNDGYDDGGDVSSLIQNYSNVNLIEITIIIVIVIIIIRP